MSKTIAIIGSGPGVGMAIARRFGRAGFSVALLGRNLEKLDQLAEILTQEGINTSTFQADVMDREGLATSLQNVIKHFGTIDVLEYGPAPAMDSLRTVEHTDVEAANYQFAFNVLGAITAVQTVLPGMKDRQDGAILFTTAVSAQYPLNITASFGIAAGAQLNYARLLHNNLKAAHIYTGIVSIAAMVVADGQAGEEIAAKFPPGLPVVTAEQVADQHWTLYTKRDKCEATVGDVQGILSVPGFQS